MTSPVLSKEAEESTALLYRTLGAHRTVIAGLKPRPISRLHHSSGTDAEQIQCQSTLVRLLSITEAFAAELLLRETNVIAGRAGSTVVVTIADNAGMRATNTWTDQRTAYQKWFGISKAAVDWKVIETLADARNAVAHGLGTLTRRQKPDEASIRKALAVLDIDLIGQKLVLSDAGLVAATKGCAELVRQLDLGMQKRPATYR